MKNKVMKISGKKQYDVFISYHRATGADDARLLQQALKARGYNVFFDYDSLRDGKFDDRIFAAIEEAPVFILMLSEGALDNCDKENDWVRLEIEHAIKHGCKLIPVAQVPQLWRFPVNLPGGIQPIADEQISEFNKAALFEESIDRIVGDRFPSEMQTKTSLVSQQYDGKKTDGMSMPIEMAGHDNGLLAGRYRIIRQCGMGETGTVLLSEDSLLSNRNVAIKFIPKEVAEDERLKQHIRRIMINHPNIATCRSFDVAESGAVFLVVDYVKGVMLHDYLETKGRNLTENETLELFGPLANAIDYMHTLGIIHGDIKPQTILIGDDNRPYIIDLGLSRLIQTLQTQKHGKVFSVAGTWPYRSPEDHHGERLTAKSDIYSFSLLVYECLTGHLYHLPFFRHLDHTADDIKLPKSRILSCVLKGLTENPDARPSSCRAILGLGDVLNKIVRQEFLNKVEHTNRIRTIWMRIKKLFEICK